MFNVGGGEVLVIALIALIVLGPQRLPGAARQVGKVVGDLRRMSAGFQSELRTAFDESERTAAPAAMPAPIEVGAAVGAVSEQAAPPAPDPPPQASAKKRAAPKKQATPRKATAKRSATKKATAKKSTAKKATKAAKTVSSPARRRTTR